jgi:uncharacterized membrane protein YbhN (UPF0104 family)
MAARRRSTLLLAALVALATAAGFVVLARRTGSGVVEAAASPSWPLLGASLLVWAGVQPLRAWAWATTLRAPVGFRAVYAASATGSFLDTVLPGRLGEGAKVAVLRVSAGQAWPGLPRAGGSLLCAHLLEGISFALVGAGAAFFLPLPGWARTSLVGGLALAAGAILAATVLRRRVGRRLPPVVARFLEGASAPPRVLAKAGLILLATWGARAAGIFLLLHALGVRVGVGAALLYLLVTGLANTAPLLPGNAGVYQGAALAALALAGKAGAAAVAASVIVPVVVSVAAAAAALAGLALYGRRFAELPRAAFARG